MNNTISSEGQVDHFLKEFQKLVNNDGLIVAHRIVNRDALIDLSLTSRQREHIVLNLNVNNYSKGPESDRDYPGYFWFFGYFETGIEIYIKLKIVRNHRSQTAKCVSFHRSNWSLNYPFRRIT